MWSRAVFGKRRIVLLAFAIVTVKGLGAFPLIPPPPEFSRDAEGERTMLLVVEALGWLGTPYAYGGASREGVDCSGFVQAVLATAGLKDVPRRSEDFAVYGERVAGLLRPGDILLFARHDAVFHVGIALSKDAFIHAASDGPVRGVIISNLDESFWKKTYVGARRP